MSEQTRGSKVREVATYDKCSGLLDDVVILELGLLVIRVEDDRSLGSGCESSGEGVLGRLETAVKVEVRQQGSACT